MSASGTPTRRIPSSLKGFKYGLKSSDYFHIAWPRPFVLMAFCLTCNNLFAQGEFREGYLITLSNDSTRGWIKDDPAGFKKFVDYTGFYGPGGATNIPSRVFIFGFNF